MRRFSDWEERLALYLDRVQEEPFAWGSHDCALHAANAVKAITGIDPADGFRGTYDDARGAAEALRERGSGTLYHTAVSWLGQPIHPAQAQRGDIVMQNGALGVCVGRWSWFVGEEGGAAGLVPLPTLASRHAWRVPYE